MYAAGCQIYRHASQMYAAGCLNLKACLTSVCGRLSKFIGMPHKCMWPAVLIYRHASQVYVAGCLN